jgi:type I restriction enzyme S subunit
MSESLLLKSFDLLATAPGGVGRLRELLITLAVQGKLLPQNKSDESATLLLSSIRAAREATALIGKVKREKANPEIALSETPHGLPPGWEWVRLNALVQKIGAGSTPRGGREVYVDKGVKFLRSQNVWNDGLKLHGVAHIKPETHAKMSSTVVMPNDLLFNITGASIGRCAIVPGDFDEANVSQHVTIVRPALPSLTPFLHLVLISRHVQQTVMDVQVGVSREGLSIAKLGVFLIPLPPAAEQTRIVARVEELMKLCDALEKNGRLADEQHTRLTTTLFGALKASESAHALAENWQRVAESFDLLLDRPEAVDALEQTIIQLAVRGLLVPQDPEDEPASELLKKIRTEKDRLITKGKMKSDKTQSTVGTEVAPFVLPANWQWVTFGEVVLISSGVTLGRKTAMRSPVSLPYLRVANVQRWHLNLTSIKEVEIDQTEMERYQLVNGDLLITEGGDWDKVGRTAIWHDEISKCLHQNHIFKARGTISDWNPVWAEMYLNSTIARAYFASSAKQTTNLASINMTQLKACPFPVPPFAEQSRIINRVESFRRLCADLRERIGAARVHQNQLAQALIEQQSTTTA